MPITTSNADCGCSNIEAPNVCNAIIYLNPCTLEQERSNNLLLQALRDVVCEIQNKCEPVPFMQIADDFTGDKLTITANSGVLPEDLADLEVYWNQGQIWPSDENYIRDYTIENGQICFTENKENCRIVIKFRACPAPVSGC